MNETMERNERKGRMEQRNSTYELGIMCVIWNSALYEPGCYHSSDTVVLGWHDPVQTVEWHGTWTNDREIVILVHTDPIHVIVGKTCLYDSFVYERLCSILLIHVVFCGSTGSKLEV